MAKKIYTNIPKNGDLLHRMYLIIDTDYLGTQEELIDDIGVSAFSLIDYIELSIGDQVIDKHSGEWLHIYHEHFIDNSKNSLLCEMINIHNITRTADKSDRDGLLYIPLIFWFNKNPGLALPLLALNNSNIKLSVKFSSKNKIYNSKTFNKKFIINSVQLLTEYIHLDTEEKRLFATNSHEYLIEQLQYNDFNNVPQKIEEFSSDVDYEKYFHKFNIPFNHPIKELFWCIQDSIDNNQRINIGNNIFNYWLDLDTEKRQHQVIEGYITLNGKELFEPKSSNYLMSVLKYQYHSGYGYTDLNVKKNGDNVIVRYDKGSGVYCYSFALFPEEYQPSGSLNFSALDKVELNLRIRRKRENKGNQKLIKFFVINYNILKIVSGQGGLLF